MRFRGAPIRSTITLVTICSLAAVGCGSGDGGSGAPIDTASAPQDEPGLTDEAADNAEPADATTPPTTASPATTAPPPTTAPPTTPPPTTAPPTTAPPTTAPPTTTPPLDPAIAAILDSAFDSIAADAGYSYEMGMSMQMDMGGMNITLGDPDARLGAGTSSEGREYTLMEMGDFMASMFDSIIGELIASGEIGQDEIDAEMDLFEQMISGLRGATMETWVDTDEMWMVMDMSSVFAAMLTLEGGSPDDLGPLAPIVDGPVLVRLDEVGNALDDVLGQLGVPVNPSMFDDTDTMLDGVVELVVVGPGQVGPHDVTIYAATVDLSSMFDTLGFGLDDLMALDPEAAGLADAMSNFTIEMTLMIDGDGQLRRTEMFMDMSDLMADLDPASADEVGQVSFLVWQEYDRFGESFPFDPPEAVDVTDVWDVLMAAGF